MLWILLIGCAMCVWTTLSLMGGERERRMSEIVSEARIEARRAKAIDAIKNAANKAVR